MYRRRIYAVAALMLAAVTLADQPVYAIQNRLTTAQRAKARAAAAAKKAADKPVGGNSTASGSTAKAGAASTGAGVDKADDSNQAAHRLQQTQARKTQEAEMKAQQAQFRHAEETLRLQQEQARQTQEVARLQQMKSREADEAERIKKDALRRAHQRELQEMQAAEEADKGQDKKAKSEENQVDEAEQAFKNAQGDALRTSFSGPRKVKDRQALPPINARSISVQKAVTPPFLIRTAMGEQRHQMQLFQQNLNTRMLALPAKQIPSSFAELKTNQTNTYFNNYPAYVNHQPVSINRKNTYIREVTPTQYPTWYERSPGWTYCNAYVLGSSVQVNSDWFGWDWPTLFGQAPSGFLCQPDYFPTPWIYVTYNDHWRQSGDLAYKPGPDSDYTGPITVETVEPLTAKFPDKFGVPVFQTINVVYFYNAFYQPEFDRWGYVNKQGYFVWLNI